MSEVVALYRLQELELDILARAKRIKAINAQLEDDAALREAEADNEAAQQALATVDARVRDMELEIAAAVDKRQSAESRLYAGEVTSPKELQDMQMEVEALGRRQSALDDELQRLNAEQDDLKAKAEDAGARCSQAREAHETESADLLAEKGTLTETVSELLARRKSAVKAIPQPAFQTYNSLRAAKSNRPVAVLRDKACTICGIEQNYIVITAINRGDGLVHCQNCGRILIRA